MIRFSPWAVKKVFKPNYLRGLVSLRHKTWLPVVAQSFRPFLLAEGMMFTVHRVPEPIQASRGKLISIEINHMQRQMILTLSRL
jgi:hypothetical protein